MWIRILAWNNYIKRCLNVVIAITISVFLIIFSIGNFYNNASALSVTNVSFGGGGLSFLDNRALQSWYIQCLASIGTTTAPSIFSPTITNPLIGSNNGPTLTSAGDSCAQQVQSYINQLLNSFEQCVMSATVGTGFGGVGATFSNAMQECTFLIAQQQGLQSGSSIINNGLASTTTTNPTTATTNPLTQYPTTSNSNFGSFQNLNPSVNSNSVPTTSSNGITTITPP
jgi:hypothetical protein